MLITLSDFSRDGRLEVNTPMGGGIERGGLVKSGDVSP
jgi:hypothetical protein